jgi:cold shock CspA family protein
MFQAGLSMLNAFISDFMQKGCLKRWNDEKGFGFIQPENSNEDVFFHISELQRSERRPVSGDVVYFNVAADDKGRRKAVAVSIEGVRSVFCERDFATSEPRQQQPTPLRKNTYRTNKYPLRKRRSRFGLWIAALAILLAVVSAVDKFSEKTQFLGTMVTSVEKTESFIEKESPNESQFKCEGKNRCSQMTSCAEAMFYLDHCPGSLTDGDYDGRPCEDQWCGH